MLPAFMFFPYLGLREPLYGLKKSVRWGSGSFEQRLHAYDVAGSLSDRQRRAASTPRRGASHEAPPALLADILLDVLKLAILVVDPRR